MLHQVHCKQKKRVCREFLTEEFPQIKRFKSSYFDNKVILINGDMSYITVLDISRETKNIHVDFTLLEKSLRSNGFGKHYLNVQIAWCKINYPDFSISRKVKKSNYVNLGLLIRAGFNIIGETTNKQFYNLQS